MQMCIIICVIKLRIQTDLLDETKAHCHHTSEECALLSALPYG